MLETGKVLDCSKELVTIVTTGITEEGPVVRLTHHPNGVLGRGVKTAPQIVPWAALDEESVELLKKYAEDMKTFVYSPRAEGGNVYALKVETGFVRFDEVQERINPNTGEPVLAYGSFTHSRISVRRLGMQPGQAKYDPNLGQVTAPAVGAVKTTAAAKRR